MRCSKWPWAGALVVTGVLMAGSSRADIDTGLMDFHQGRFAETFQQWQAAAVAGDARAALYLGVLFDTGLGVPRDLGKALDWYRRAAELGSVAGEFNVGVMYDSGLGTPQDWRLAAEWYGRAAAQGSGRAEYNLAMLYEAGMGVPRNLASAIKLYREAAMHGVSAAKTHLAVLGIRTVSRQPVVETALQDFLQAQHLLLTRGLSEATQAADLFHRAAEQGNSFAEYDLAYCYERGIGVPVDRTKAYDWYQRVASHATDPTLKAMAVAGVNSLADKMTSGERLQADQMIR